MFRKYEGLRIVPTYYCNKNCSFCYQKLKDCSFMNLDLFHKKVLQRINFIPAYITFMGGELSCFPELTKKLMNMAHDRFPMVYAKSFITNGNGEIDWYKDLKNVGITKIIFSCHSPEAIHTMVNKIETIATSAFFTARVNCFLDDKNLKQVKEVVEICKEMDVPLTLCSDINQSMDEKVLYEKLQTIPRALSPVSRVNVFPNHAIVTSENYQYWIYCNANNYNKSNLIVLPDCSMTNNFRDVENCKGVVR